MIGILGRREFLRRSGHVAGVAATVMLAGCGDGGGGTEGVVTLTPTPLVPTADASNAIAELTIEEQQLNVALMLAYAGAQYHGIATNGTGMPAELLTGRGERGGVAGGRKVASSISDAVIMGTLATDKLRQVTVLRAQLAGSAAAQPSIDFSAGYESAFSMVARAAGIAGAGGTFDPFADADSYVLGGIMLERQVAALHRNLAMSLVSAGPAQTISSLLPEAIYHDALLRTMLEEKADANPALRSAASGIDAYLLTLEASRGGSDAMPDARDADNHSIAFVRSDREALTAMLLKPGAASGGFLPSGPNGVSI